MQDGLARRRRFDAVDAGAIDDSEVRTLPHGIEVGEGGVEADSVDDVDQLQTEAKDQGVEIVEAERPVVPGLGGGVEHGPMKRPDFVFGVGAHACRWSARANSGRSSSPDHPGIFHAS